MFVIVPCNASLKKYCCREAGHSAGQYDWNSCPTGMNFLSLGGFASTT